MKKRLVQKPLYVKKSATHGYGVFAGKNFRQGETLEECYFIITKGGDKTLEDYYFEANNLRKYALFTGYGSIYNHSDESNADYTLNLKRRVATIKASKPISKGSEILISYGEEWFKSRGTKPKKRK